MLIRLSEHLAVPAVPYNHLWNVQLKVGNAVKTIKSFDRQVMKQETNANVLPSLQETDDYYVSLIFLIFRLDRNQSK